MTIKAAYNTLGEKVFSFPSSLYSNGNFAKSVNNTDYKMVNSSLASFDSNDIAVFEGNDGGYFITVMYENEPVDVISSFVNMEDLNSFLEIERSNCQTFNYTLSKNDVFFSYYLLAHLHNRSNPAAPHFHLLIRHVKTVDQFYSLFNVYESLYKKYKEYGQCRVFSVDEFVGMLTEEEISVLKVSHFCNSGDALLCDSWQKSFLHSLPELKNCALETFGIHDSVIDGLFQTLKMHPYYFIYRIRDAKGKPSIYYFDAGIESYLKPEDELILWRSGQNYRDYLVNNYEYIEEINEPDDRA